MPVKALEDKLSRVDLEEGAEMGQEIEDEGDEETKFWEIPMAFNSPRHLEVTLLILIFHYYLIYVYINDA